jgi:hypothetical protein
MMRVLLALRVIPIVLLAVLLSTASNAQQVGSYPIEPVTIDEGAFYCKTPELVMLLLDMSRRYYEEGQPMIPINGCGRTSQDHRATMLCIRTYNNGLTETDIIETKIGKELPSGELQTTAVLYVVGEERLVWAII